MHLSRRNKRICVCSTQVPFIWGGSEIFYENLISRFTARSLDVELVRLPLQPSPHEELLNCCLAWRLLNLELSDAGETDLAIGTRFPSYLVRHPNKVIWLQHQHRQMYDLYDTEYSDFTNSSSDNQIRHSIMDLESIAFGEARKIYSQSKTVAERLKHFNGIDSEILYPPIDDADRFSFLEMDDFVLSVARLAGNKRIHLLIEAMQYVSPKFRAVIVGEGQGEETYKQLASSLHLLDRIEFTGKLPRSRVIDLYARAGAVFYGPVLEDYGYATLEAFYARKPVITCSDSGGVCEFVDSTTGWVAEPQPEAIAACIQECLANKQQARERGDAGYKRVSFLNWDYVLDKLLLF